MYGGNKTVSRIALIEAVVDVESPEHATVKWSNISKKREDLISQARARHERWRSGQYPVRVFVLGEPHQTEFKKASKGGMQTSKRYFDVGHIKPKDAADLAAKLSGKTWKDY